MIEDLKALEVITFFVEDLLATKAFYADIFNAKIVYEDAVSCVFKLGNVMINLLQASEVPGLIAPAQHAKAGSGARALFTINVEDVDSVCAALSKHSVKLANGPIDRPWGRRTASFADPAGNLWEVAQNLPQ